MFKIRLHKVGVAKHRLYVYIATMKKILSLIAIGVLLISCSKSYEVKEHLNDNEQLQVKMELCRYMDLLPPSTTMDQRWSDSSYSYYLRRANAMHLLKCYKNAHQEYYFLATRIVASIRPGERRAHIGKFKFDGKRISQLEEFYLSNILPEDTIVKYADALFTEVVNEGKIDSTSSLLNLVEWPNAYFAYDTLQRSWERREFIRK